MQEVLRKASTPLVALLLAMTAFVAYTNIATASHEPANKGAAAGSDIDEIDDAEPILSETMKVSSPQDLVISVSTECAIITELITNNDTPSSTAFGSVRLWVTVDGKRVPVASDDPATGNDNDDQVEDAGDESDQGEVTFCNRAYSRTVTDGENPPNGIDTEADYIRSRTANAFNWLAIDTGTVYDDPANGNNILTVQLWADYDVSEAGNAVADAFVGSRTMIIEPIKLSIHEQVNRDDTGGF